MIARQARTGPGQTRASLYLVGSIPERDPPRGGRSGSRRQGSSRVDASAQRVEVSAGSSVPERDPPRVDASGHRTGSLTTRGEPLAWPREPRAQRAEPHQRYPLLVQQVQGMRAAMASLQQVTSQGRTHPAEDQQHEAALRSHQNIKNIASTMRVQRFI